MYSSSFIRKICGGQKSYYKDFSAAEKFAKKVMRFSMMLLQSPRTMSPALSLVRPLLWATASLMTAAVVTFGQGMAFGQRVTLAQHPPANPDGSDPQGVAATAADNSGAQREGLMLFENKIRPALVEHCYACHSVEAQKTGKLRGGLMLDTRDASRTGGETGPAVVPGKPDESLLVTSLRHESFEMPPKGKLPDAVIADFVEWIELGAPDPRDAAGTATRHAAIDIEAGRSFWAFAPLSVVHNPPADETGWSASPIDRFVIAEQKRVGLHPNPHAPARILVRRAWFDLLGLPPTEAELRAWVAKLSGKGPADADDFPFDDSAGIDRQAWAELIDHLLASPHYGPRWARHWMDIARFAESHGYEQDYDRSNAYHYRDFLIRAFNDDMPYDQFVRWQLAGDELNPENPLAWMATGFLGGGAFPTQLTETEFESARYDELDDMVATTGVAFLGLSTGCARCHDHKFSPIPVSDYYRMAACFTTAIRTEKQFDLEPERNRERLLEFERQSTRLADQLRAFESEKLPGLFREWLLTYQSGSLRSQDWGLLSGEIATTGGSAYLPQEDGSYLATTPAVPKETITLKSRRLQASVKAIRLEALTHESFPRQGPGRADNGNFALGDFRVEIVSPGDAPLEQRTRRVKLVSAKATFQQNDSSLSVTASIDDDPTSGWAVDGQIGKDAAAVFYPEQPFDIAADDELVVTMRFEHPNQRHIAGRLRLSITSGDQTEPTIGNIGPDPKLVEAIDRLKAKPDEASADWPIALGWFKGTLPAWRDLQKALTDHQQKGPQPQLATVMVTSEGLQPMSHHADGRGFPHFYPQTHLLRRGDVNQKVEVVSPGFLQVLVRDGRDESHWKVDPPSADSPASYRRASLARWITDPSHGAGHLAARVMANRLWQHHFGVGLVANPNDFGGSGEPPSHPALLDWLADDLIDGGWKLKRLHKLIMTSSVYMQSSDFDAARGELDPENRFLWRRVPRRVEAEAIRDAVLSVSGVLDPTPFGPGTLDQNMRRRSVYFFIKRSQLIPMMMLFDWPEHLVSIGQRSSTTTAPQALFFMNSPQVRSYADAWAAKLQELPTEQVARRAYLEAFGRFPSDTEIGLARGFIDQQTETHRADPTNGSGDAARRVAVADLCQMLMSMNEFVYID
jgi:mono/diheme cytochrome c family protein